MKRIVIVPLVLIAVLPACSMFVARSSGQTAPGAGQQVINHYIDLFNDDWDIGTGYNPGIDGMGYAQSYDRYGSPAFKPFIRPSEFISGSMKITPIESPVNSESAIIRLINSANETLLIEQMYIYETLDDILSAIINAHDRGVNVSVIQGEGSDSHNDPSADILETAGIEVRRLHESSSLPYPVPFDTMHNKGVIVDGKVTLIASINWSPTSLRYNRECGVIVESQQVAGYYVDLFNHDWNGAIAYASSSSPFTPTNPDPSISLATYIGSMNVTAAAAPDNCFDVVNGILASAEKSIDISVYTLSSPYLIETIRDRIASGVDVRILLEKSNVGVDEQAYNRWSMMNLTVLGVDMGSYNLTATGKWASSSFDFQHCKYAVIDNATMIISSGNWGRSSCPKPQDDDEVDGNRDWWFVIHGDGVYAGNPQDPPIELPWWAWVAIAAIGFLGGVVIQKRAKKSPGSAIKHATRRSVKPIKPGRVRSKR